MTRNKELARNTVIFAIGTLGSKAMQFFLVPLYTIYLTTADYSTSDIITSTVTLLMPFLILGMNKGLLRYVLGKPHNRKSLLLFSLVLCVLGTLLLFALLPALHMLNVYRGYEYIIPILFFFTSLRSVFASYCKAIEKNREYAINSIVTALLMAILSWLFLGPLNFGIAGFLWAHVFSNLVSCIFFLVICNVKTAIIKGDINIGIIRETLNYSIPLIPNELAWWIIHMSDRYMLTWISGAAINGIYTMAYKIPGIFNLIVSIFIQAFSITVFKEFDLGKSETKFNGKYFEKIYTIYLAITFVVVVIVILISQPIAYLFIKKEFYSSWQYTPFLLIAFAIGNLESFMGSILGGAKKTVISFFSTFIGAVGNIFLNLLLIPKYSINGAIIATVVSYFIVYIIRVVGVKKYVIINLYIFKSIVSLLFLLPISLLYVSPVVKYKFLILPILMVFFYMYYASIMELFNMSKLKLMTYWQKSHL